MDVFVTSNPTLFQQWLKMEYDYAASSLESALSVTQDGECNIHPSSLSPSFMSPAFGVFVATIQSLCAKMNATSNPSSQKEFIAKNVLGWMEVIADECTSSIVETILIKCAGLWCPFVLSLYDGHFCGSGEEDVVLWCIFVTMCVSRGKLQFGHVTYHSAVPVANGYITYTHKFKYLGSILSWNLNDQTDIENHALQACKTLQAMMSNVFRNPDISLHVKHMLYMAIPMNLLLWECDTWALKQSD
eukprot:15365833-Ditylum_brightwellii.AAC.1